VTQQPSDEYFAALERLTKGHPTIVSRGVKITNDAVALEAGRGKGSIKKSRPVFADLIHAIDAAAREQARPANEQLESLNKAKAAADQYRRELDASIAREISLLHELYELKQKLFRLTGESVLPLRGKTAK
jgi:ABC-type transporter Mla subunit MlaD